MWQKKSYECWNEQCPFPRDVEFMIADTMECIRPKFNMFSSLQESQDAVNELSKEYNEKISKLILFSSFFFFNIVPTPFMLNIILFPYVDGVEYAKIIHFGNSVKRTRLEQKFLSI